MDTESGETESRLRPANRRTAAHTVDAARRDCQPDVAAARSLPGGHGRLLVANQHRVVDAAVAATRDPRDYRRRTRRLEHRHFWRSPLDPHEAIS